MKEHNEVLVWVAIMGIGGKRRLEAHIQIIVLARTSKPKTICTAHVQYRLLIST